MSASKIKHFFPFKQNASTANSSLHVCQEKFCKLELLGLKLLKGVIGQGWATSVLERPLSCRVQLQPLTNTPTVSFIVILKTLISLVRCVWLGLELNSAGQWPKLPSPVLSWAYNVRFSSDFEPNSDLCDFFESGRISALSCSVRAVYRGKREAISLSRQAIGRSDEFLTCQKFWSPLVRVSHNWSKATNRLP